jgi:hypothetical protein
MKFFNKDLGNRLWGMSISLWLITSLDIGYNIIIRIIAGLLVIYFITFGNSRFTEEYKKII